MAFQLDHNIFFQGLNAQQNRENSMWDALMQGMQTGQNARALDMKRRQMEAEESGDYEGNYLGVLTDMQAGKQVDPERMARARAYEQSLLSQNAINPTTGEAYPKNSPVLLGGKPSRWYGLMGETPPEQPSFYENLMGPLTQEQLEGQSPKVPNPNGRLSLDDLQSTGDPEMDKIRQAKFAENAAMQGNPDMTPTGKPRLQDVMHLPPREAQAILDGKAQLPAPQNEAQRKANYETQLKIAEDITKMDYQSQMDTAKADLQSQKGRTAVSTILERMNAINEELSLKGGIVSGNNSKMDNIMASVASSAPGQMVRKPLSPEIQALADEYKSLQATLLPYYASASGLTAKSLDSDGERKSILSSFGDPASTYEANKNQLGNLRELFGQGDEPEEQPAPDQGGWGIRRVN